MKLHGTQTRKNVPNAALWVWQTWNYMGSNLIGGGTGLERERLQGTQTLHYVYLSWSKVWRRKKLQGSQTKLNFFSVWKKVKLHGTQTHATLWWKITESSNSVTRSYGALEKAKIAWYSNISCMANQPTLKKSKIVWFSNKQGPNIFAYISTWKAQRNRRSTCAHFEQRSMRNPQRFEGLEEDEITWYSNRKFADMRAIGGLEEDEITWYSNVLWNRLTSDFSVGFGRR